MLNTQKGSSTRLQKNHAVGHGRGIHSRVPSHGKGLNKLSKLAQGNAADDANHVRHHKRSASHTPSTSPGDLSNKRNSSTISLQRPSSRGTGVKKNASHPNLARNGPITKLGNAPKSEKSQIKKSLLKKGTDDVPLRGTAQFEVGDEEQDDEWTEDSSSQSPATTRTHSRPKTPVTPAPKELPTPDEPPERLEPQLPDSPPESPKLNGNDIQHPKTRQSQDTANRKHDLSHPPDAQAVTTRLLSRNGAHVTPPQTSNISANITPHHVGSPKFSQSQASTNTHEPSMPADGISRFLSRTNSTSGSTTPGSISNLQQNMSNLDRHAASDPASFKAEARRVKSAANLTHARLSNGNTPSPPTSPNRERPPSRTIEPKKPFKPSPFESARGANPAAGKSYTQLKLNLDREASSRDPPVSDHPLLSNSGSMLNLSGSISANPHEMAQRVKRQYMQAQKDVGNCRRYYPEIITGKVPEKALKRHELSKGRERKAREKKGAVATPAASSLDKAQTAAPISDSGDAKRGRVRFEVGSENLVRRHASEERQYDGGTEALLRRMWMAPEAVEVSEGD